ncbi:MAG: hypothetical protein R3F62_11525 [Planctomycetota bacterium]
MGMLSSSERWQQLFTRPNRLEDREDDEASWQAVRRWLAARRTPSVRRRILLRPRPDAPREPGRPCPECYAVVDTWQPLIACSECLTVYHAACAALSDPCPGCGVPGDPPLPPVLPWAAR